MVEAKNYKNNGRRYNRKGNFRNYKNSTPMKKKGLLNFLFSFNGKISKELFMGATLPIAFLFVLTSIIPVKPEQKVLAVILSIISIVLYFIGTAIAFKRAHSLGISGIYSIVGDNIFTPFFAFFKPERDFSNDMMYKSRFEKLRKIGYFFDRNVFTRILFMFLIILLNVAMMVKEKIEINTILKIYGVIFAINVFQLFLMKTKFMKKHYATIVKVFSFIGLVIMLLAIGFAVGYAAGIETILKAIAAQK